MSHCLSPHRAVKSLVRYHRTCFAVRPLSYQDVATLHDPDQFTCSTHPRCYALASKRAWSGHIEKVPGPWSKEATHLGT